jgi:endonuclease/exonuclease/phosphatase family metal-dependent hydrolase
MTLNLAHGRQTGLHQLLQTGAQARAHLDAVATVVAAEDPHLLALQEADGPSFWSGNFDHLAHLARQRSFAWHLRGEHVRAPGLSYGTGLISTLTPAETRAVTFAPRIGSPPKGFLLSRVSWPGGSRPLDVVSVHLDPLFAHRRRQQAVELIAALEARGQPLVLMGDFNTDWGAPDSALRYIAEALDLKAHRPQAPDLVTFPGLNKRLDWILISSELQFLHHQVLQAELSDHRAVVAWIGPGQPPMPGLQARSPGGERTAPARRAEVADRS